MKKLKFNKITWIVLSLSLPIWMISCEKSITTETILDQLFRPVTFKANVDVTNVTFTWVPIAGADYSLEVSRDSLLYTTDLQVFKIDSTHMYMIKDLWSNSVYSARIKAVSKNSAVKDSGYKEITFKTGIENIFYPVSATDFSLDQVMLKWDNTKNVSTIIVSTVGKLDSIVPLSPVDILAGQKLITGLSAGTNYVFKIYLGGMSMLRGTVSVTTKTL